MTNGLKRRSSEYKYLENSMWEIKRPRSLSTNMNFILLVCLTATILLVVDAKVVDREETKRGFSDLGCMGVYDKAKFARLDRVCEECYQLYREPDVHTTCRSNCFKNEFFTQCVDALLLRKDQQKLDNMVEQLYGKRK